MQIFFSFYQLKKNQPSNSKSHATFQNGALIKIVDDEGNFGVADLCPWPELGDLTLQQEIATQGMLFQRCIELAQSDLKARRSRHQLVSTGAVKNHLLITNYENFRFEIPNGFYKIKGNKNFKNLSSWLHQHLNDYSNVRLDFNCCLNFEEFSEFVDSLSNEVLKKIEVVEDPFAFDLEKWTLLQKKINLAIDFEVGHWPNKIFKPSRQMQFENPLYLTSSMDHPIGIAHGLHFAQKFPQKTHGFLTLDIYEKNRYSQAFEQESEKITYLSDGNGIGFTTLLLKENWVPQIDWENSFESLLLYNPQSTGQDLKNIFQIKNEFLKTNPHDHILIPSSGSTQKAGDLKVLAFHKDAILQSARRVVQQFQLTSELNWACVLPLFHVGGLGVLARAHVASAKVFYSSWADFNVDFLVDNHIRLLSLVPTQLFDLVNAKIQAPKALKHVFVGGAFLDEKIELLARELGWPLVLTYGMTETASMISAKDSSGNYRPFSGVDIFQNNGNFFVKTDSTAMAQLNFSQDKILRIDLSNSAFEIPDRLQLNLDSTFKILGRIDDQIKISGELVNLNRLRAILPLDLRHNLEIIPLTDERKGSKLALVGEQITVQQLRQIAHLFNQSVNKFEKIEILDTLKQFPRTGLDKIKLIELKTMIEKNGTYEKL